MLISYDNRDLLSGKQIKLQAGDVGLGIHVKDDGQTISTEPGKSEHVILPTTGIVLFGIPRFTKQDKRNSTMSVASQVYNFVLQNPNWYPNNVYRPIYDVSLDDGLALALLSREYRNELLQAVELPAVLTELNEWSANKYNFVKRMPLRYINNFLNLFAYPFYEIKHETRKYLCNLTLTDLMNSIHSSMSGLSPIRRSYPKELKFTILESNQYSAMIEVLSSRYGSEDLIVQEYFESNPETVRIISVRKLQSAARAVTIFNTSLYDTQLRIYPYVDTRELNIAEKLKNGNPDWKNLKVEVLSPRGGTLLDNTTIWTHAKLEN